jgi:hypothetical protein
MQLQYANMELLGKLKEISLIEHQASSQDASAQGGMLEINAHFKPWLLNIGCMKFSRAKLLHIDIALVVTCYY